MIMLNFTAICVLLDYFNDRQMSELYFVFNLLTENNLYFDISSEDFIKLCNGQEK